MNFSFFAPQTSCALTLFLLFVFVDPARAQVGPFSPEIFARKMQSYLDEGYQFEKTGDCQSALQTYLDGAAHSTAWCGPDHAWTAMMESHAAHCQGNLGNAEAGLKLSTHALPILQQTYGADQVTRFRFLHGFFQSMTGLPEQGIPTMEQMLKALANDKQMPPSSVHEAFTRMTLIYHRYKRWNETRTTALQGIKFMESSVGTDAPNVLMMKSLIASSHVEQWQMPEARAIYEELLSKLRNASVQNKESIGNVYFCQLCVLRELRDKTALLKVSQEAEAYVNENRKEPAAWQVKLLHKLGMLESEELNISRAREKYQQAAEVAHSLGDRRLLIDPMDGLSFCDFREGHAAKAIATTIELIKIAEELHEIPAQANAEGEMASMYGEMRDMVKAMPHARRSLELWKKERGNDAFELIKPMVLVATLEQYFGNTAEAMRLLKEGTVLVEKHFERAPEQSMLLINTLALALRRSGDHASALRHLDRIIPMGERLRGKDHEVLAQLHASRSSCYDCAGRYEEALAESKKALAIKQHTARQQWNGIADDYLDQMASAAWRLGDKKTARELTAQSIPTKMARFHHLLSFTSENQRRALIMNLGMVDSPANFGMTEETAGIVLNTKGMVMESLMRDLRAASKSARPEVQTALKEQREFKAKLREAVYLQGAKGQGSPPSPGVKIAQEQLEEAEQALFSLLKPDQHKLIEPAQVAAALPPESALLDWFHYRPRPKEYGADVDYGLVVYQPGKKAALHPLGRAVDLDDAVGRFYVSLMSGDDKATESATTKLLGHLLGDSAASLAGVKTLYICPDEVLHLVPFAILRDEQGRLLGERFSLRRLTSARDVLHESSPLPSSTAVEIFADPDFAVENEDSNLALPALPGTRQEAKTLEKMARTAGMKCHTALGADATEPSLRSLHAPGILHLGTHGYYQDGPTEALPDRVNGLVSRLDQPMERAGIALAGVTGTLSGAPASRDLAEDGRLSASEAAELDLENTWLVSIGACGTAAGSLRSGDGVASIQRGFLVAGARQVLAPLWPVGDRMAADFMEDFYHDVFAGKPAPDALLSTQMKHFRAFEKEHGYCGAILGTGAWILVSKER